MKTFYRLLGFLKPYKRPLGISWGLASLAMVMSVALPALTGRAVEAIRKGAADLHGHPLAREHDRHTLLVLSLVILASCSRAGASCTGVASSPDACRSRSNTTSASGSTASCSASSSASSTTSRPGS